MKNTYSSKGFGLFELVTVIAVISIIVLISTPFFSSLLKENQAKTIYTTLKPILAHARAQSHSLHQAVALCGSKSGQSCDNDWNGGILLFLDYNQNRVLDHNEQIIGHYTTAIKYGVLSWRGAGSSRSNVLLFEPERGRLNMSNGSFWYCAEQAKWHRLVILSNMGHVRSSKDSNGDGIHETAAGSNISC